MFTHLPGVLLQLLPVLAHLPGQVLGHVDVGAPEEVGLAEHLLAVLPVDEVHQHRAAAADLERKGG